MFLFRRKNSADAHYYKLVKRIFRTRASNIDLYKLALVHRSASVTLEDGSTINNERLEFLGDAVLELLVSEMLFVEYPELHEGDLTKFRSKIVCRASLNNLGRKLGLNKEVMTGAMGGRATIKADINGDTFEALCGALYLDKGFDRASKSILQLFANYMNIEDVLESENDYKSRMLEWAQHGHHKIEFWCEKAAGYSAHNPLFECVIMVDDSQVGYGASRSKKAAEQSAAADAFKSILAEQEEQDEN